MADQEQLQDKSASRRYVVPALDKGLEILELLSEAPQSLSQADIARALGRNTSEIFRTLSALETRGYLRRTQGGQYRLTLKLFELSRTHSPYEELLRVAYPVMRDLSEELLETCHLTTLRDGEIVVLAQNEAPKPLRLSVEVGSRHSPLTTTSGRILLSAMSEEARSRFLEDQTDFHALPEDERKTFLERVNRVRLRGFEVAEGERFVGGLDVGVLIGSRNSSIRAALIVATLKGPHGPDPDKIQSAVIAAGARLSELTGIL